MTKLLAEVRRGERIILAAGAALAQVVRETPWPPEESNPLRDDPEGFGYGAVLLAGLERKGYVVLPRGDGDRGEIGVEPPSEKPE